MRAASPKKNGPSRLPTKILEARGSKLTYARDAADEPQPDGGIPPCPPWVSPKVRTWWATVGTQLEQVGILTTLDGLMFGALADAFADYLEAKDPETTSLAGRREARKHLAQLAREFGLTPSARSGLTVIKEKPAHGNAHPKDKTRFLAS